MTCTRFKKLHPTKTLLFLQTDPMSGDLLVQKSCLQSAAALYIETSKKRLIVARYCCFLSPLERYLYCLCGRTPSGCPLFPSITSSLTVHRGEVLIYGHRTEPRRAISQRVQPDEGSLSPNEINVITSRAEITMSVKLRRGRGVTAANTADKEC